MSDFLCQVNDHQFGIVENTRDAGMVSQPSADHTAVFQNSCRVLRKNALPGGIGSLTEKAPLTAVRVSAKCQFNVGGLYVGHKVFGVVAQ